MHTRRSLPRLSQFLFTLFFLCVLVGMFSLVSLKPAHAATAMPYPGSNPPVCDSKQDVHLSGGVITFGTHVSCNLQVTSLNSQAFVVDRTPDRDEGIHGHDPFSGSVVRNSCNNCRDLLNPSVGRIAIHVGSGGESRARHYVVEEGIVWTYVDRGGTHIQSKDITTTASSPPPEAEVLITPAQFHLLNVVKSRLGKTPYRDTDIVLLIIHAGYNNPDTIADIIRGGSVGSASELYRVFDEPTIAVTLNSRPEAEQRALVQRALKYNPAMGLVRSVLLQWSFDNLRNTGNFRPHALDHIFKGDINASGQATGYHYEGVPSARGATKHGTDTLPDKYGVYEAEVKVNGVDKSGHGGKSTFFPRSMTPQGVVDSINEAYNNKVRVGGNLWEGHASSGMPIQMALDGTGKIITAYPVVTPP